jgi:DNA-binding protein YbaB
MKNLQQMQQMLKQVQQFQEQLQKQLDELSVEASAGGGMVSIKMMARSNFARCGSTRRFSLPRIRRCCRI